MFNVYPCTNDKSKVLIESDIETVACMFAAFGQSTQTAIIRLLINWGFTEGEAETVYKKVLKYNEDSPLGTPYGEAKTGIVKYLREYIDSVNRFE